MVIAFQIILIIFMLITFVYIMSSDQQHDKEKFTAVCISSILAFVATLILL